ncbi:hypothetical protein NE596_09440, partial [Desulfovibrio desulfuricans]
NRNLKDFLPTRYSLVNEPLGLFGPPARLVAAWREERLCPLSFPESTTFFRFAKVFRGDRQSFSQGARSVYAPLCFRSQQLFPFRETFCFTVEPVVFLQSRGAVMLLFAFEVNHFFSFPETFVSP